MSETKRSVLVRCQKCGGRMFQDKLDKNELRCLNCGAVRYFRHTPSEVVPEFVDFRVVLHPPARSW